MLLVWSLVRRRSRGAWERMQMQERNFGRKGRTRISFCPKCTLSRHCVHIKSRTFALLSSSSSPLLSSLLSSSCCFPSCERGTQRWRRRRGFCGRERNEQSRRGGSETRGHFLPATDPRFPRLLSIQSSLSPSLPPSFTHKSLAYHGYCLSFTLLLPTPHLHPASRSSIN